MTNTIDGSKVNDHVYRYTGFHMKVSKEKNVCARNEQCYCFPKGREEKEPHPRIKNQKLGPCGLRRKTLYIVCRNQNRN